jgi:hypothetical protein
MVQSSGIPLDELRQYMFMYKNRDAIGHLMRCGPSFRAWFKFCYVITTRIDGVDAWALGAFMSGEA